MLSGESQVAVQLLPIQNLLTYYNLKQAILQRVGHTLKQHHQHFIRSVKLGESSRPFVIAQ